MTNSLKWAALDGLAVARRNLSHIRVVPEKLIDATLQPLLFVVLFAYVFGGSIHIDGIDYKSYLVAGIFVQTLAFGVMGSATSMAEDMHSGIIDRFRALPMARSAVLVGRTLADLATTCIGIFFLAMAGLIVGWGIHSSVPDAVAGLGLLLLFGMAMSWCGTLIGLTARSVDAVAGIVFVTAFPLTFVANTFVTTQSLPGVLQTVAEWNPISAMTAAIRQLFGNTGTAAADQAWPLAHPIIAALLWCVVIIGITAPLAVRRYRTALS